MKHRLAVIVVKEGHENPPVELANLGTHEFDDNKLPALKSRIPIGGKDYRVKGLFIHGTAYEKMHVIEEPTHLGELSARTQSTDEWFEFLEYDPHTDSLMVKDVYYPGQYTRESMSSGRSPADEQFKPGAANRDKAIRFLKEYIDKNGPYKEQIAKHLAKYESK